MTDSRPCWWWWWWWCSSSSSRRTPMGVCRSAREGAVDEHRRSTAQAARREREREEEGVGGWVRAGATTRVRTDACSSERARRLQSDERMHSLCVQARKQNESLAHASLPSSSSPVKSVGGSALSTEGWRHLPVAVRLSPLYGSQALPPSLASHLAATAKPTPCPIHFLPALPYASQPRHPSTRRPQLPAHHLTRRATG